MRHLDISNRPRAIETRYAGYRFRSRLEARWAVFFDALDIGWEYEPQGFTIDGRSYLPDFWLPDEQAWIEVKGGDQDNFEGEHVDLCRGLADITGAPVMLLTGPPEYRMYNTFRPGLAPGAYSAAFFAGWPGGPKIVAFDADNNWWLRYVEVRQGDGALMFNHDERGRRKSFGQPLVDAITAARAARFEYGERG